MPATRIRARGRRRARRPDRLDLVEREEEAVAELRRRAEVAAGVVVERHRHVQRALVVLLDRTRPPRPPGEREVEDVAARARAQPHAAARAQRRRRRPTRVGPGALGSLQQSVIAHARAGARESRRAARSSSSAPERRAALEDLARARVGGAHLGLLLLGQREHVEDQQLVDLARVEQVARALGRDPRVVRRG